MSKGPNQGQLDLANAILAGAAKRREGSQTYQQNLASGGAASRRGLSKKEEKRARKNLRKASSYSESSSKKEEDDGGGFLGGAVDDFIESGKDALGTALNVIDTPRAALMAGATQGAKWAAQGLHDIGLNEDPPIPKSVKEQADTYAAKFVTDKLTALEPWRKITPAEAKATAPGVYDAVRKQFIAENGKRIHMERQQWRMSYEPSFSDFSRMFENHQGFTQSVNQTEGKFEKNSLEPETDIGQNLPWGVNFAAGLAGDVAFDPLGKVIPAGGYESAVGAGIKGGKAAEGAARFAVGADGVVVNANEELVRGALAKLGRSKTIASLTSEEAAALGERGGYKILGMEAGGQNVRNAIYKANPLNRVRGPLGDMLDNATWAERLRGGDSPLKQLFRSGDPEQAFKGAAGLRAQAAERNIGGGIANQLREKAMPIFKGLDDDAQLDLMHAVQGDRALAAKVDPEKLGALKEWYAEARELYVAETGQHIPHLDDYVNRELTDEMRRMMKAGEKKVTIGQAVEKFVQQRKIGSGSELFGETVPEGLDNAGVMRWANERAKELFGHDMYKTDLKALVNSYSEGVGRAAGRARANRYLLDAGLLTGKESVEVAPNAARIERAEGKLATAQNKAEKLGAEKGDVIDRQLDAYEGGSAHAARADVDAELGGLKNEEQSALLGGEGDLNSFDAALDARTYHDEFTASLTAPSPEDVAGSAKGLRGQAERAAKRAASRVEKDGVPTRQAGKWLDISDRYHAARQWADEAATAGDDATAQVAVLNGQAELLEGQMLEMGIKIDSGERSLARLKLPKVQQQWADEVRGNAMRMLGGEEYRLDPQVGDALNRVLHLTEPREIGKFMQTYDKVLNWLKAWQIATPGFHSRNLMGGMFNNALEGIDVSAYRDYLRANHAFTQPERWAKFRKAEPDLAHWYEEARHASGRGQIGTEFLSEGPTRYLRPSTNNVVIKASRRAGEDVEGFLRGALIIDTLKGGGDIETAIQRVNKVHFDYADLSTFERTGVKRVIPFYTWSRHNMPLQIEMLAKRPSVYSKYNAVTRNLALGADKDNPVPAYFGDLGAFPIAGAKEGGSQVYGTADPLPLGDIAGNPLDPEKYMSMVAVPVKMPIELWAGRQFFKGLPIGTRKVETPAALEPLSPVLEKLGLAKNGQMPDEVAYAIEQWAPQIARSRRLVPNEKKYQDRVVTSWLNFILNQGLRVNTPTEKKNELLRRQYEDAK